MQKKLVPLLGVAFVVAVISTGIFYGLIVGKMRSGGSEPPQSIVVAAQRLDRGAVVEKASLKLAPVTAGQSTPKGAFTDPQDVAGLTVLEPIDEAQPVTQSSLSSRDAAAPPAQAIPSGMRAVSLRVNDSPGVIAMLHAGNKVDVQAVRNRPGNSDTEVRTVLQDVQVLTVLSDPKNNTGTVLTVLAKPDDADVLGVADAGAKIRVLLRNPKDSDHFELSSLVLAALYQPQYAHAPARLLQASASATSAGRPAANSRPIVPFAKPSTAPAAAPDAQVQFRVQIAEIAPAGLDELSARLAAPRRAGLLQVSVFRPGWNVEGSLEGLKSKKLIEILSASNLVSFYNQEVGVEAGVQRNGDDAGDAAGVKVQLVPSLGRNGRLRVKVEPEITSSRGEGVITRKIQTDVELSDGQGFLVTGLVDSSENASLIGRLFPGRPAGEPRGELVVIATPLLVNAARAERRSAALLSKP